MKKLLTLILLFAVSEGTARWFLSPPNDVIKSFTVHNFIDQRNGAESVLPLAGLSRQNTFLCQENSGPILFTSDRFGFNNKDTVWDEPAQKAYIGDSFVHGHCVQKKMNLVAGQAGVLNLGLRGSGPFSQLAVLKEYAIPKRPQKIYWFILANDFLFDLSREVKEPELLDYLENKSQRLMERQVEIDRTLRAMNADSQSLVTSIKSYFIDSINRAVFSLFRIQPSRAIIEGEPKKEIDLKQIELFVLPYQKGAELARLHGISVEFYFIPDSWFFSDRYRNQLSQLHSALRKSFAKAGLKFHSPLEEMQKSKGPLKYYSALNGYYGHFNEKGFEFYRNFIRENSKNDFSVGFRF